MNTNTTNIVYLIQSHRNPQQIERLVLRLRRESLNSFIVVSHDSNGDSLPPNFLDLPNTFVIQTPGGRGSFATTQGYLNVIQWLKDNSVNYSWIVNISGQDYPAQSLRLSEEELLNSSFDGYMEYFDILKPNPWGELEGFNRYYYYYNRLKSPLKEWEKAVLKLPKDFINLTQDYVRVNNARGLLIGFKRRTVPFNKNFICYGGGYFKSLRKECAEYLLNHSLNNTNMIDYYSHVITPEESYMQTVLINSGLFKFSNNMKRYIDFSETRDGHPRTLTKEDCNNFLNKGYHFARKFKANDPILDYIDTKTFPHNSNE